MIQYYADTNYSGMWQNLPTHGNEIPKTDEFTIFVHCLCNILGSRIPKPVKYGNPYPFYNPHRYTILIHT